MTQWRLLSGGVALSLPPLFTRAFILAALANSLLNFAAFLFVHLPGFLQQLGAGEAQIGRIMAAQAVGAIAAAPVAGHVMDTRGRRVVVLTGVALFILAIAMYLAVRSTGPLVYVVRMLDGAATMMWYTALFTHAADLVPVARRTEGLAIFGISGVVAIGLGAQSGDMILTYTTYRGLFAGALVLAVMGLTLCMPLRDIRATHSHEREVGRHVLATAAQRNLWPVWIAAFAFFVAVVALFTFMKTFVTTTGAGSVGAFFAAYAVVAVALRVFAGRLPERLGTRRTIGVAMSCYAAGLGVLSLATTSSHVIGAGLLCGAGHGYTFPVLLSLVVGRARSDERGAATAFFTTLDWLGLLIAGPVVGLAIERMGYRTAFVWLAILQLIAIGVFYSLDRRDSPSA
jgi:predicted MFS family arabinose efflux permease